MKYVLVTGANGGMGKAATEILKNNGFFVFALDNNRGQLFANSYRFCKSA